MSTLANRVTTIDRAYDEAVDAWEIAAAARVDVLSALRWIEAGDVSRGRVKVGGRLPALRLRQRDSDQAPATFEDVVATTREVTSPREAQTGSPGVAGSAAAFFGVESPTTD